MASSSLSDKRSFSDFQRKPPAVSRKVFDAFINHRGPDVKDTLAFALYDSLEEKECWTFLDDMELQLGDSITSAIQDAIYSSRVQITIFSPRYAESSWCLDELLLMLETKVRFIPIFCDVKPIELRYLEKGVYAAAFAKHEDKGRVGKEKIDQWKSALHSSSLISGYEFTTSTDNVERLCTTITLAVQQEVGKLNVFPFPTHGEVGLHSAASTSKSVEVKKSSLLPRDSHPVGVDSKVEDIKGFLQDPQVPVIAVVGMGGSGKTFLLQNVYKGVKTEYHYSIWLSISQSYSLKNLQNDIASHIGLNSERVSEERAAEMIQERLEGKRCLIVLDDLWEISTEHSLMDKLGLPAHKDCKIVITTRDRWVALNSGAQIYEMKNLLEEDSWKLFCLYAFPDRVGNTAPQHLEVEAQKIVKQCGNLPLAIKIIAASLSNSTLPSKWKLKRRQLEKVVTPIGDLAHLAVMKILKLSYDSLPPHLKPCFGYLSSFSEDEEIEAEYLIYLWIGEGFIPAGEDQWDLAWDWLDQLARLCLLHLYESPPGHLYDSSLLQKYCKIHDLLHDLAIQISKEDKCFFSVEEVSSHTSGATGWHRILLAKKDLDDSAMSEIRPLYLRTLSLSRTRGIRSIPENLFATMRGLRVLDLSDTRVSTLPTSLGKMILLKVLNLRSTEIEVVPECVRHLRSLFFLALPASTSELPESISELECLQHLECDDVRRMPKGISKLRYLRTLRTQWWLHLSIEEDGFMRLDDLVKMTQLQKVSFRLDHEIDLKRTGEGILAQLVNTRHLGLYNLVTELGRFPEKMRAMKHLEYLFLREFVLPGWICEFKNMRELYLCESEMQRMPKEFGKSGGFPVLRILVISYVRSLEEFPEVEEGAMASLQRFKIRYCSKLKKVEGLERLKMLEKLYFTDCYGLRESIREGGDYWNKIKSANPNVVIKHK